MTATTPAVVRTVAQAPSVPCPCGTSTRVLTKADGGPCSFHVTQITDSVRHYHAQTTEVYNILEGTGQLELDGIWHEVAPGSVILIPAGVRHRVVSPNGLKTIVVAVPPFDAEDEHFD